MPIFELQQQPLWINVVAFGVAAAVVWFAGTRLSGYAKTIAEQTGFGQAFIGLLLLGGITSLPELAVSVTASLEGNAALAVNNLLGGVAMQVAVIAFADLVIGRGALSPEIKRPSIILLGALDVLLLVAVAAGIVVGDVAFAGIGAWSTLILVLSVGFIYLIKRTRAPAAWQVPVSDQVERPDDGAQGGRREEGEGAPLGRTVLYTVVAGVAILAAGYVLTRTADAIAVQTGLGASFVGAVFLAFSTSLPEVSTVFGAIRLRQHSMAFADIFGTNLIDLGLIFVVDAVYPAGPVLNQVGRFSAFAALLGIAVTTLFIAGLLERRRRAVLRMGLDSIAVLATYLVGLVLLYRFR